MGDRSPGSDRSPVHRSFSSPYLFPVHGDISTGASQDFIRQFRGDIQFGRYEVPLSRRFTGMVRPGGLTKNPSGTSDLYGVHTPATRSFLFHFGNGPWLLCRP